MCPLHFNMAVLERNQKDGFTQRVQRSAQRSQSIPNFKTLQIIFLTTKDTKENKSQLEDWFRVYGLRGREVVLENLNRSRMGGLTPKGSYIYRINALAINMRPRWGRI